MSAVEGDKGRAVGRFAGSLAITVVLCAVQFVDVLGVTVVITALPSMLTDLDASTGQGTLVVTAYAACFGGLLMLASRVGDRVGHRRLVVAAVVVFAAASLLGAVAASVWVLVAARAVQGVAAAASVPSALRLLTTLVPEGLARRRAVAGWSAAGAAAGAAGFAIGGVLSEFDSWRAVFWVNIAIAVSLVVLITRVIPADQGAHQASPVPWLPAGLLTVAAMSLVGGPTVLAEDGPVVSGLALVAVGVATGVGFWVTDRKAAAPLVPVVARRSARLGWGVFGSFANTATTSSTITVATLYLQQEHGLSPLRAAGTLVSFSVLVIVGSSTAPWLIGVIGWRRGLGLGLAVIACGNATLVLWPSIAGIAVAAGLGGLGIGVGSVAATDIGTHVTESIKATAAGAINTAAQLGTAIGTAVILLIATTSSAHHAWMAATACATIAALAAARQSDATLRADPNDQARNGTTARGTT
ncbi:MFS transporter [Actinokineospora sp. G85]|uniref:MFS transporter n=1 Tax=Actinokineospora sp. G85 TaxID=3406626 RepID=UPI003C73A661